MSRTTEIRRLSKAIGYPQEVPAGADQSVFWVDGHEILAKASDGGVELSHVLLSAEEAVRAEDAIVRMAGYAAGRLIREEAALAWDSEARAAILWMRVRTEGEGDLRRGFESFCSSVDWWSDRVGEERVGHAVARETVIRP